MICISLKGRTLKDLQEKILKAEREKPVLIELRLDYLNENELTKACSEDFALKASIPTIICLRSAKEGGKFLGNEDKRMDTLKGFIEKNKESLQIKYLDIELSAGKKSIESAKQISCGKEIKLVISHHDYSSTPEMDELERKIQEIKGFNPEIIKVFTFAEKHSDSVKIIELMKKKKKEDENSSYIFGAMGDKGRITRLLGVFLGNEFTYSGMEDEKTASGQLSIQEIKKKYLVERKELKSSLPELFGVIGCPIEHSKSPFIYNNLFKKLGRNALLIDFLVEQNDLDDFFKLFNAVGMKGIAITLPLKSEACKYADSLEPNANRIQAINTIAVESNEDSNPKLTGYNTDYFAGLAALKEKTELNGKKVALFGAGGVAKAIGFALKNENAEVTVINRTPEKGKKLAEKLDCRFIELEEIKTTIKAGKEFNAFSEGRKKSISFESLKGIEEKKLNLDFDIIINCTNVGMRPLKGESVVPLELLHENLVGFDTVYNPLITQFLKDVKSKGGEIITGMEMFMLQAMEQFKIFTEKKIEKKLIEEILKTEK